MNKQFLHHSTVILLIALLSLKCFATPIGPMHDQSTFLTVNNNEEQATNQPLVSKTNILCALYGLCSDDDHLESIGINNSKYKRLSSNLFHGIPKFGKRIYSSAFSGIPKFG